MKVFFTEDHPIKDIVSDWQVVSDESMYFSRYIDQDDPSDTKYPLKNMLYKINPDVVFLVDLFRRDESGKTFGYRCHNARSWSQTIPNKLFVSITQNDPLVWNTYTERKYRSCMLNPAHCSLYVTNEMSVMDHISRYMRVAYFDGADTTHVLEAISHCQTQRTLNAESKRIFK